ncbi:MAG TPA: Gfo/Idh/MocA family oxidoreductase [Gaiellaceae bacterium]|jgi:predicted dehydrogenase
MEPVRWGVLSTARINHAVLEPARETDKAEVIAVASREAGRAQSYAREHGVERAYGSYVELLADPEVEAVYNSLPNSMHVDWSIRALEAGKHVLVEKPLARRPEEVKRAYDVADGNGRLLMEAFMYRHHPQTHKLREIVQSGAIGELRQMRAEFCFTLDDSTNVRLRPELDGGSLMDLGCYCVGIMRLLAGEPELVFGRQRLGLTSVDLGFTGVLQFPGDVFGELHCAFDLPAESGVEAIGSNGSVVVPEPFRCRGYLDLNGERVEVGGSDRYLLQLENLSAAIRGEAEPLLGRSDALGQARAIAALYRSAASGASEVP